MRLVIIISLPFCALASIIPWNNILDTASSQKRWLNVLELSECSWNMWHFHGICSNSIKVNELHHEYSMFLSWAGSCGTLCCSMIRSFRLELKGIVYNVFDKKEVPLTVTIPLFSFHSFQQEWKNIEDKYSLKLPLGCVSFCFCSSIVEMTCSSCKKIKM